MKHVTCEKCDSKKTQVWSKGVMFVASIAVASIFFWIGFILPFLWIITVAFFIGAPLALIMPKMVHCKDCNHVFLHPDRKKKNAEA